MTNEERAIAEREVLKAIDKWTKVFEQDPLTEEQQWAVLEILKNRYLLLEIVKSKNVGDIKFEIAE